MAYAPPSQAPRRQPGASRPNRPANSHLTSVPTRRGRGSFLAGLGIGLAVGAAVALLFAPQSGADTRRALRRRGERVRTKAGDAWSDLRYELSRAKRALKRKRREALAAREDEAIDD